jgi:hypothetical protein
VTDITNDVLTAGVYQSSSTTTLALNGTVTFDAEGNPDAVFIFQAGRDLVTSVGSVVELVNEAQACNVFWQVTSSATIGGSSDFAGHVLALTSIFVGTSATIDGSLLARNGEVTLLENVFQNDECADNGGDNGGDNGEGLASTGASDWALPITAVLSAALILTAVFVIRARRRIGRHSA